MADVDSDVSFELACEISVKAAAEVMLNTAKYVVLGLRCTSTDVYDD